MNCARALTFSLHRREFTVLRLSTRQPHFGNGIAFNIDLEINVCRPEKSEGERREPKSFRGSEGASLEKFVPRPLRLA